KAVVLGNDRPAVGELPDVRTAGVDHRLHGEDHAGLESQPGSGMTVMQHLGLFVEFAADSVAAEFPNDRKAARFSVALDGVADVAERRARPDPFDAPPHTLLRDLTQPPSL